MRKHWVGRVRSAFGVHLSLRDFFKTPTIADLTRVVEGQIVREVQQLPETEAERLAAEPAVAIP